MPAPSTTAVVPFDSLNLERIPDRERWVDTIARRQLFQAFPGGLTDQQSARLQRVILQAFLKTPKLTACSKDSIAGALVTCAQLGLEPNTLAGDAYLIPYKGACTFVFGYKGMAKMAYRSPRVKRVVAGLIWPGEHYEWDGIDLHHKPDITTARDLVKGEGLIAAYATVILDGGERVTRILGRWEVEERKSRSASAAYGGPWSTDYAAMARKSAIRALLTSGMVPLEVETWSALESEQDDIEPQHEDDAPRRQASAPRSLSTLTDGADFTVQAGSDQPEPVQATPPKAEPKPRQSTATVETQRSNMVDRLKEAGLLDAAVGMLGPVKGWGLEQIQAADAMIRNTAAVKTAPLTRGPGADDDGAAS